MHDLYDHHDRPFDDPWGRGWGGETAYGAAGATAQRLRHLVFLDGLLVDSYAASVEQSPYAELARDADLARRRSVLAPTPREPEHERMLAWLDTVAGGRRALLDLDAEPLVEEVAEDAADHPAYDAVADLLERTAHDVFHDEEIWAAARHCLDRVWAEDHPLVTGRRTAPQVAGGVLWVVGRANGLFGQRPAIRQKDVQRALWLNQGMSATGKSVERCLLRLDLSDAPRPWHAPTLHPYGDARLLTSSTRRDLLGWRDRALDAQRRHRLDEEARREGAGVLPPEVES